MSAFIAGLDLTELLLLISCGDTPPVAHESREGVRTHIAMQALLGCAIQKPSRWRLLRECWRLLFKRGPYSGSREELTPVRWDWASASRRRHGAMAARGSEGGALPARRGWGSHLLNPQSVRKIRDLRARPDSNGNS